HPIRKSPTTVNRDARKSAAPPRAYPAFESCKMRSLELPRRDRNCTVRIGLWNDGISQCMPTLQRKLDNEANASAMPETSSPEISKSVSITRQKWCAWLAEQEQISFDEYQRRPNRLVSDFNGERTFITDYIGREILELLQNANDAAAKAAKRGSVHFEL